MRRAVPLLENVLMAALAGVGFHEELRGDIAVAIDLRGAGEEFVVCSAAFTVHGERRDFGIADDEALAPGVAGVLRTNRDEDRYRDSTERWNPYATSRCLATAVPPTRQQCDREKRNCSVGQQQPGVWAR